MTENFSIFGFQRASCRERNPTSEKRNPVSRKINSETEGGNAAKIYEKRWNWLSTRVKWLCNLLPFQPIFVLLGGAKHNSHNWKHFLNWIEYLNWILRLAEKEFQYRKIIHEIHLEKRTVCVSKQEFKTLFWRTTSMIRTNHTSIVVTRTRAMFYFQQLWPLGFPFGKMFGVSWQFVW